MPWWMYKCNSGHHDHQVAYGDWQKIFGRPIKTREWGSTEWTPALEKLAPGDRILAYQTDRNELVGVAEVIRFRRRGSFRVLYLRPIKSIGVKVRPLKQSDPIIDAIPCLRAGPIMTIYEISSADAHRLLKACGAAESFEKSSKLDDNGMSLETRYLEGERRAGMTTARNPRLRLAAKRKWGSTCYCCDFDFGRFYGTMAKGFAIVHHLALFSGTNGRRRKATVADVRVVCANCHYVLHLTEPPLDVDKLRAVVSARKGNLPDKRNAKKNTRR